MSSSFHKRIGVTATALLLLLAAGTASAQLRYFIPRAEARVEGATNRELRSDSSTERPQRSVIYKATVEALIGQASPRSDIQVTPRLIYQEFPNCKCVDRLEKFLDLKGRYHTEKALLQLDGHFAEQDTLNAEGGQALFDDDSDPGTPPVLVDTGVVRVGQQRTRYEIEPSFHYSLTQRSGLAGLAQYQSVHYEAIPNNPRTSFKAPYAELAVTHEFGPRNVFDIGPYYARYEADNNSRTTDTYGTRIGWHHRWSEVSRVDILLRGERNKSTVTGLTTTEESSTNWGLEIGGERRTDLGGIRYSLGRYLQPSGLGSRRQTNLIQLEYNRALSERTLFTSALRLTRDQSIGNADIQRDRDRDRVRVELSLARQLTRTWELSGGYRFSWQDLGGVADQADSHGVFLTVGFNGLDPRRPVK